MNSVSVGAGPPGEAVIFLSWKWKSCKSIYGHFWITGLLISKCGAGRQSSFHQLNTDLLDASPWMYFCHSAEIFLYSSRTVQVKTHLVFILQLGEWYIYCWKKNNCEAWMQTHVYISYILFKSHDIIRCSYEYFTIGTKSENIYTKISVFNMLIVLLVPLTDDK